MKRVRVESLPGAIVDGQEAYAWYAARDDAAAEAFTAELDKAIEAIETAPDRWPLWLHGTRRFLFRRFPFFVVYKIQDSVIWIVAIAHHRRRPGYWRKR